MPQYDTPGVYFERPDSSAGGIAALRTDVAAFVGIAERGPLHTAVPVESWRQFQAWFGRFTGVGYLAYVARAFFENGGRRCWIVRVASEAASSAAVTLTINGAGAWRIEASSPGAWGNALEVRLVETRRAQTRSVPRGSTPEASVVQSTAGFARGGLVEVSQGGVQTLRVVSDVDAAGSRLLWVHEQPEARLPYDAALAGVDAGVPLRIESITYTVEVYEAGTLLRVVQDVALVPEHPRYGARLLALPPVPPRVGRNAVPPPPAPVVVTELRDAPALQALGTLELVDPARPSELFRRRLAGGGDGLVALGVRDFVGEAVDPGDGDVAAAARRRGLAALDEVDEVAIVAVPDIHIQPRDVPPIDPLPPCVPDPCLPPPPPLPPAPPPFPVGDLPPRFDDAQVGLVQGALVLHCERHRDRIALLDPPFSTVRDPKLGTAAVRAWRRRFDTRYAAVYFPWVVVVDPLRRPEAGEGAPPGLRPRPGVNRGGLTHVVPPSGHVAGQFAATDLRVGVHKAPANAPLAWAQDVTQPIDDAVHGVLNPAGINALRVLPGRGLRIYGARTVSSDPDWRFVNVRRLVMMIEKAIDVALQWAVFEPNDFRTRAKLTLVLDSFLRALWQGGALMGAVPAEGYFVRCHDGNNPPSARDRGELLAEVGVAPSVPFEFVVLRIGRGSNGFEISEADVAAGVGA